MGGSEKSKRWTLLSTSEFALLQPHGEHTPKTDLASYKSKAAKVGIVWRAKLRSINSDEISTGVTAFITVKSSD